MTNQNSANRKRVREAMREMIRVIDVSAQRGRLISESNARRVFLRTLSSPEPVAQAEAPSTQVPRPRRGSKPGKPPARRSKPEAGGRTPPSRALPMYGNLRLADRMHERTVHTGRLYDAFEPPPSPLTDAGGATAADLMALRRAHESRRVAYRKAVLGPGG